MAKITQFDSVACRHLRERLNSALAAVAADEGIKLEIGKMTYTRDGKFVSMKLDAAIVLGDGRAASREADDFLKYAAMEGLKPEHLNAQVSLGGRKFTIRGYRARSPRKPIELEDAGGKIYVTTVADVKRGLGIPQTIPVVVPFKPLPHDTPDAGVGD